MKRLFAILFLAAPLAYSQATRVDIPLQTSGPTVSISGGPLPQALWVANARAYVCVHPSASLSYCQAHPLTTYTDSTEGTPCATATPLVQLPGSACTAATGATATIGLWYDGGTFDYWLVSSYGTYGPFSYSSVPGGAGGPFCALAGCNMTGPFTTPTGNGIINAERYADLPTAFAQLSPTERHINSDTKTYIVYDTLVLPSTLSPTLTSANFIGSNRDAVIIKAGRNVIKTTADVTVGAAPTPNQMWVATATDAADLSIGVPINLAGADTAGGLLATVSNGYLVGALRTATYVSGISGCPLSTTETVTFTASSTGRAASGSIATDGSGNPTGAVTWTSPFGNGGGYPSGVLTGTVGNCTGTGTFNVTAGNLVVLMKPAVTTVTGAALTAPLVLLDVNNRAVVEHITLDADGYPAVIGMNFHTDAKMNDIHFMGGFAAPLMVAANSGTGAYTGGVTTGSFYTTLKGFSIDGNCDNTRTLASNQVFPVGSGSTGCTSGTPTSSYGLYDVMYGGNPPSGVGWNALIKVEGNFKVRNTTFACAYNNSGGILEFDQFDCEATPGWGIYNQYGTIKQKNGDNEQNKLGPVFINPWVPLVNAASSIDGNSVLTVAKTSYVPGSVLVTAGSNQVTFANPTFYAVGVGSVTAVSNGAAWNFSGSVPPTDPWGVASTASPSSTNYEVVTASGSLSSMTVTSGGTSCTNGTQTITGTATGVQVPWVGTVLVTANAPGGAVTLTNNGSGYNSVTATGSFTGKVATCTGNTTVSASVGITMATAATSGNGGPGGALYGPITANYIQGSGAPATYTQVWKTESQQFYESPVIRRGIISGTTRISPAMGTDSATWQFGQTGIPTDNWLWTNEDGAIDFNTNFHPGNTGLTTATYVSGLSGCTPGTNAVTFTGTGSGAKGTIVTTTVPAAAAVVTITLAGWNYTGTTGTATVATCTGTGTFNIEQGGKFTAAGGAVIASRVSAANGNTGPAIVLAVAADGSETQLDNTLASGTTGFVPMSLITAMPDGTTIFKNLIADNTDGGIIIPHLATLTPTQMIVSDGTNKLGAIASPTSATPPWLNSLGSGADGANTSASGNLAGEKMYTNFTVPFGNTVTVNSSTGLHIRATGTCTIAGTINLRGNDIGAKGNGSPIGGGCAGGSGGGTLAGTAGAVSNITMSTTQSACSGGAAGAVTGGDGGDGNAANATALRLIPYSGGGTDGIYLGGSDGRVGGSSSGQTAGLGAGGLTLSCASITGTDGSHTGTLNGFGSAGTAPTANSTGAPSGGGGGVVIMNSIAAVATWPTVYVGPSPGSLCVVPQAIAVGGTCTTSPRLTLGVSAGAFDGTAAVVTAGAGCGTGTGLTWQIQGGGGTQTTAAIVPTWSGGAVASATVTVGDSAGYTAATFSTCGKGGAGGPGSYVEYANGVQIH